MSLSDAELDTVIARLQALRDGRLLVCFTPGNWVLAEFRHIEGYSLEVLARCSWLRIAEPAPTPAPAPVEYAPWTLSPEHAGKVVVRKDDPAAWGTIQAGHDGVFNVSGWGTITPSQLLRDWLYNGSPCGVRK